jgi:hypothetical protein
VQRDAVLHTNPCWGPPLPILAGSPGASSSGCSETRSCTQGATAA